MKSDTKTNEKEVIISVDKEMTSKEPENKANKPSLDKNKSSKIKNLLFNMHKEEASNLTKESKPAENQPASPKKKTETFQSPIANISQDKGEKKGFASFSRMTPNMQNSTTPFMTPGYEGNARNIEQMNQFFYGGSQYDQNGAMKNLNEFSGAHFPTPLGKSPVMASPSPAFRHFNRFGPETPQTGLNQRNWNQDKMSFYPLVSSSEKFPSDNS